MPLSAYAAVCPESLGGWLFVRLGLFGRRGGRLGRGFLAVGEFFEAGHSSLDPFSDRPVFGYGCFGLGGCVLRGGGCFPGTRRRGCALRCHGGPFGGGGGGLGGLPGVDLRGACGGGSLAGGLVLNRRGIPTCRNSNCGCFTVCHGKDSRTSYYLRGRA